MNNDGYISIITSRKSVRKWKKKLVSDSLIKQVLTCGLNAPSAYNASPWEFIVVNSSDTIEELLEDRYQMKQKPFYINSEREAKRAGIENYEKVDPPPVLIVGCGNLNGCNDIISVIQSVSCACENILLACHTLGLGACWLYVYDPATPETEMKVKKILHIPKHILVLSLIAIGYPNEKSRKNALYSSSRIHINTW